MFHKTTTQHFFTRATLHKRALYFATMSLVAAMIGMLIHLITYQAEYTFIMLTAAIWVFFAQTDSLLKNALLMIFGGLWFGLTSLVALSLATNFYYLFPFAFAVIFINYALAYNDPPLLIFCKLGILIFSFSLATDHGYDIGLHRAIAILLGSLAALATLLLLHPLGKPPNKLHQIKIWEDSLVNVLNDLKHFEVKKDHHVFLTESEALYQTVYAQGDALALPLKHILVDLQYIINTLDPCVLDLLKKHVATTYQAIMDNLIETLEGKIKKPQKQITRLNILFSSEDALHSHSLASVLFDLENLEKSVFEFAKLHGSHKK